MKRLGEKRQEIGEEMKREQTAIDKSEMILKRSTSAQIMQPGKFLDELFREEGEQEDTAELDGEHVIDFFFLKEMKNCLMTFTLNDWAFFGKEKLTRKSRRLREKESAKELLDLKPRLW